MIDGTVEISRGLKRHLGHPYRYAVSLLLSSTAPVLDVISSVLSPPHQFLFHHLHEEQAAFWTTMA